MSNITVALNTSNKNDFKIQRPNSASYIWVGLKRSDKLSNVNTHYKFT